MPVSVVHLFEVIHIKHQQSKASPELLEFLQRLFRLQFDIASIRPDRSVIGATLTQTGTLCPALCLKKTSASLRCPSRSVVVSGQPFVQRAQPISSKCPKKLS